MNLNENKEVCFATDSTGTKWLECIESGSTNSNWKTLSNWTTTAPTTTYSYSFPYSCELPNRNDTYVDLCNEICRINNLEIKPIKEEKKEMLKIIDVKIGYEKRAVVDKTKRDANGNYLAHKEEFPVVTIVTFENKRTQKAYCDKDDTFNLETGITICVAKELMQRLYGENENKNLNKIIRSGLRLYEKLDKLAQKVLKQLEEDERIEKNRKAKEQKRRLKRADKKKEREIEILAEAIRRANADSK